MWKHSVWVSYTVALLVDVGIGIIVMKISQLSITLDLQTCSSLPSWCLLPVEVHSYLNKKYHQLTLPWLSKWKCTGTRECNIHLRLNALVGSFKRAFITLKILLLILLLNIFDKQAESVFIHRRRNCGILANLLNVHSNKWENVCYKWFL